MKRHGSVLILSLVMMSVMVVIAGALGTYYVHTAKIADFYLSRSRGIGDRLASRSALSQALAPVIEKFNNLVAANSSQTGVAIGGNSGLTLDKIIADMEKEIVDALEVNGETVTIEEKRVGNNLELKALINGCYIMSVTIEMVNSAVLNTLEIFDYVYFANNHGQLTSSYIIANGDVGSNGDFSLNAATVNGYVRYLNNFSISGTPHAWSRSAYLDKVASEFSSVFSQVRPTNPNNSVEWIGGYESICSDSPYTWEGGEPPDTVDPPGIEPAEPTESMNIGVKDSNSNKQPSTPPES